MHDCPVADVWRAEDLHRWGYVYCDELHQACASTYHPDGNVVIPMPAPSISASQPSWALAWQKPAKKPPPKQAH